MFRRTNYTARFETQFVGKTITMRVIRTGCGQNEEVIATHVSKSPRYIATVQQKYQKHFRSTKDIHVVS